MPSALINLELGVPKGKVTPHATWICDAILLSEQESYKATRSICKPSTVPTPEDTNKWLAHPVPDSAGVSSFLFGNRKAEAQPPAFNDPVQVDQFRKFVGQHT